MFPNRIRPPRRRGATLIDVATGSMILALLLVPSVRLIGESRSSHRRLEQRELMVFEAERLIETAKVSLSEPAAFDAAMARPLDVASTIRVDDGPTLTGRVTVAADSTIPGSRLLTIDAVVWHDIDRDRTVDSDEISEAIRTQWAAP